jgi:fatty-acyl-CoA synthase
VSDTTSGLVVPELLARRVAQSPDDTVMNVNDAETITYAEWDRRSNAVARGLLGRGLARGEVVALYFGGLDWIEYIISYMAILKAGGTAIHLNDTMPTAEVDRRLGQCSAVGIIHGAAQTAPPWPAAWTCTRADLDGGDTGPVDSGIGPDDISDILYSSGTTTMSKAVRVPHGNLTFGRGPEGFKQLGDPRPLITPMQVGTTASVTTANVALTLRATLIVSPPGDVERMAELIARYRVGSVMINPMVAARLLTAGVHERHDLSSVHTLGTAAAPMPPPLADRLLAMFPHAQMKGSYTEISAVPGVIVHTYDPAKPLSVGRPTPSTELMIADEAGRPAAAGELGEIWLRCRAPRRRPLDPRLETVGGWTRTQDLGRLDPDGDLRLFDRVTDAIRVDGKLISTIEVEAVVYEHPAVREAAVVGVPGADGEPEVALVVALRAEDDLASLRDFLAARLAAHEMPTRFLTIDALPFSPNGKVRKTELRARLRQPAPA